MAPPAARRRRAGRRSRAGGPRHRAISRPARVPRRTERPGAEAAPSTLTVPVHVGAHAGPQLGNPIDGVGSDLEGPEIEVSGRTGRAPSGIFAACGDGSDFDADQAPAERGHAGLEPVADLESLDEILAQ